MPVIETAALDAHGSGLDEATRHQVYCGLDSMLTHEVYAELTTRHTPADWDPAYTFERALQAPILDMCLRGFATDPITRHKLTQETEARATELQRRLDYLAQGIWGRGLNPRSFKQLCEFFYGTLRLPEVWLSKAGERKLSINREALEKLDDYLLARPFVALILALRDCSKQLDVLRGDIDADGRFRSSYNIAGTETGRLSSSTSSLGTGGNAQNIAPGLRRLFIADPGFKLCSIDLEQVEARDVGFLCGCLFGDWSFLDACERGDLHTNNARLVWPELAWGDDPAKWRSVADRPFYREFTFRDMAKRGGHLSNYSGGPHTMARSLKIPLRVAQDFQARYCRGDTHGRIQPAYPVLPRFWQWVAQEIQQRGVLVTPFGRRRQFFGRTDDASTIREAIAFLPQSTTADRTNLGLWRIWRHMPEVQLLAQTHDSVTFQYRDEGPEAAIVARALDLMRVELTAPNGRRYSVPGEAKIGWNWAPEPSPEALAKGAAPNPDGLRKFKALSPDTRTRSTPAQRLGLA